MTEEAINRLSPSREKGEKDAIERRHGKAHRADGFSRVSGARHWARRSNPNALLPNPTHDNLHASGSETTRGLNIGILPVFSYSKSNSANSTTIVATRYASSLGIITLGWAESTWNARSRPCLRSSRAFFSSSSFIRCLPCSEIFGRTIRVATGEAFYQLKIFFTKLCQSPEVAHG